MAARCAVRRSLASVIDMQRIASLGAGEAGELLERLKKEAIPVEVRPVTQESGLDICDIMVEDSYYERACDVADTWEEEQIAEAARRSKRHCPKCRSPHVESVPHDKLEYIYRCKDCGCEFTI